MNNTAFLDKKKTAEYILTGLLAMLVLATVLFPIRDLDQITTLGNEIQYWGGAMSILGQDWSQYMDGQAMVSYGYSLILVPICMLFQNATFAYKAAIILNGCFWAAAYLVSVKVGKKVLKEMNPFVSAIGCFFIYLFPIYGESRTIVGPQALMILLVWICVDLVCQIREKMNRSRFLLLGLCLILLTWLDIAMIAVVAGTILYVADFRRKGILEEERFLRWILFILIGICLGYFIEQIFLYHIFKAGDISYSGSIQVMFDKAISNWSDEGIIGLLYGVTGKLFALTVNTLGLILPAFYLLIKRLKKYKKESELVDKDTFVYCILIMLAAVLSHTFFWMGVSEVSCRETLMMGTIAVVVGPVLLFGIREILSSTKWMEESIWYTAALIGMAFVTSYIFKNVATIPVDSNFALLFYSYQKTETAQGMIYFAAVVALAAFLLVFLMLKTETKWKRVNQLAIGSALLVSMVSLLVLMNGTLDYVNERHASNRKYQQVADILNTVKDEVYCDGSDAALKSHLPVLQMLSNQCDIVVVDDEALDNKRIDSTFISSAPYYHWEDEFEGYDPNCQIHNVVVWSPKGSEVKKKVDEFLTKKEYKASKVKGGSKSAYGKHITLTSGTYAAKFYVDVENLKEKEAAVTFHVKVDNEVFQSMTFSAEELKEGKHTIELQFTNKKVMENVTFHVNKAKKVKLTVDKVTYQKVNGEYKFGLNCTEDLDEVVAFMEMLNQKVGREGTTQFLENIEKAEETDYIICSSKLSFCYDLLQTHSILYRNNAYALLAPTGNQYCTALEEMQGFIGSEKNSIDFRTFLEPDEEGNYDLSDRFKLESGDYRIFLKMKLISNESKKKLLGVYRLKNGSKKLAGKRIYAERFNQDGIYEISLPLILYNNCNAVHYELDLEEDVEIQVLEAKLRMNDSKYAVGSEKDLSSFADIINKTDKNANVSFWTERKYREKEQHSLSYLESLLPECDVDMSLYSELMDENGDKFVITRNYSANFFKFVSKYTIIAQEGRYLLWARSDGSYILDAMKNGATMLSQGNKISSECLAHMQGKQYDGTVHSLPAGNYRFYIEVLAEDDMVEIGFIRDKTEEELKEEKQLLENQGYSKEQIEGMVGLVYYTTTHTYNKNGFSDEFSIVHYQMKCEKNVKNVKSVCYAWNGSSAKSSILWIEML